jgi:V/A-type H+-transporting ATPase subunit F
MKLLVIGHQEAVLGFSLVGVEGRMATTAGDVSRTLDEALSMKDIGIILVTQELARLIQPKMDQLKLRSTIPLVIEIPGPKGPPPDEPSLGEIVLKAIGIKL